MYTGSEKGIVAGLEQAIGTMKLKESAQIVVKSQYAYGEEGNAELGIPGGAELTYDVRLNNFTKVSDPPGTALPHLTSIFPCNTSLCIPQLQHVLLFN